MPEATAHRSTTRARVLRVRGSGGRERADRLAAEEPMEVRAGGPGQSPVPVAVTMRTPGHDFELAAGFLLTEGLIGPGDVEGIAYCADAEEAQRWNAVSVRLRAPFHPAGAERRFAATASCGICGKASLEEVEVRCAPLDPGPLVAREVVLALPGALRQAQRLFASTGGLHAAGLFDASGALRCTREDVGRHNAVDKVVGRALLDGRLPLAGSVLMVSGRLSFEIVQKAAVAGIPVTCAVSAPSSLAVEAAERLGMTLVGFVRGDGFNVYAHPERIALGGEEVA
jgi:FdhD protein